MANVFDRDRARPRATSTGSPIAAGSRRAASAGGCRTRGSRRSSPARCAARPGDRLGDQRGARPAARHRRRPVRGPPVRRVLRQPAARRRARDAGLDADRAARRRARGRRVLRRDPRARQACAGAAGGVWGRAHPRGQPLRLPALPARADDVRRGLRPRARRSASTASATPTPASRSSPATSTARLDGIPFPGWALTTWNDTRTLAVFRPGAKARGIFEPPYAHSATWTDAPPRIGIAGLLGRSSRPPGAAPLGHRDLRPGRARQGRQRRLAALRHRQLAVAARGRDGWSRRPRRRGATIGSREERRLAHRPKDVLVGVVAMTGVIPRSRSVRFARSAPNGAVPLRDGDHAAVNASPESARRKRRVSALGVASLVRGRPRGRQRGVEPGELPPPAGAPPAAPPLGAQAGGSRSTLRSG